MYAAREALPALLATPGFGWLVAATLAAGMIRGFAGFGTALVYLPVAGAILPPFAAITTLLVMDIPAPLVAARRAMREADLGEMARLVGGSIIGLPLGVIALGLVAPEVFRYAVSVLAFVLLAALVGGLRYQRRPSTTAVLGTGGIAGFLGGSAGMAGPPVILFYMASTRAPQTIRATILLFLIAEAVLALTVFGLAGRLAAEAILIGFVLTIPNAIGIALGSALFDPRRATLYRRIAYAVIAASALSGLPLWD